MATLVLIPAGTDTRAIDDAVKAKFGNSALQLPRGEWLVSYAGTSKQLSDEMGITNGDLGTAVILNFDAYYGRAPKTVWEWLKQADGS